MLSMLCAVILALVLAANVSGQAAAGDAAATTYPSVKDYLESGKFSTFLTLVRSLNLEAALDEKPYTIFAPTDEAFDKFFTFLNVDMNNSYGLQMLTETFPLASIVRYHVAPQVLTLDVLRHATKIQTFLKSDTQADKMRITVDRLAAAPAVVFRGWESFASVVSADVQAGKSVIHVLDNVLLPRIRRDPGFYPPTLLDMLTYHNLTSLRTAMNVSGLIEGVKALNKTVTLMAPTNEAFAGAMEALGTSLDGMDKAMLANLVRYHMADGFGTTARMIQNGTVFTWLEDRYWNFKRNKTGELQVVSDKVTANLVIKDSFSGSGCVVHVIDQVLFPKKLKD